DKNDCNLLAQAQVKCGTPEAGQGPAVAFHGLELLIVMSPSDQVYRRRRGATTPALLTARLTQGQPQKQRRPPLEEQVDCQQQPENPYTVARPTRCDQYAHKQREQTRHATPAPSTPPPVVDPATGSLCALREHHTPKQP